MFLGAFWSGTCSSPVPPQLFLLYFLLFEKILSQPLGMQPFYSHLHCEKCPAHFGVISICNVTHGTLCSSCIAGISFSPAEDHLDACQPCSLCGEGFFVQTKCTTISNTVCSACHQQEEVSYSWEYYRQCLLRHEKHSSSSSRASSSHSSGFLSNTQQKLSNPHSQHESFVLQSSLSQHPLVLEKSGLPQRKALRKENTPHIFDNHTFSTEISSAPWLVDNISSKYAKNPDTVLAVVLLATFFALGCACFFAVFLMVYLQRRRIINFSYGGVRVTREGTARLLTSLVPSGDPYDDDEAII